MKFVKYAPHAVILIGCLYLFLALLYKDPFSERTLIPNFEPYPDTIHYVNPARSFLRGDGLKITREGRDFYPSVPPLYSIILIPIYAINSDPRMVYYTNAILSVISFFLFYLIARKIFKNIWITGFILLLFSTNHFLYWQPTLAMAENLTLPLFLGTILLLLSKTTIFNAIIAGLLTTSFFATKYANISLTIIIFFLYTFYLFKSSINKKLKVRLLTVFFICFLLSFASVLSYEVFIKGNNFFGVFKLVKFSAKQAKVENVTTPWLSLRYVPANISMYLKALYGEPARFLWEFKQPLVSKLYAIPALIGFILSLFFRKKKFISISLIIFLLTNILFISTFYTFDLRYIYHLIPVILLGFGFFLYIFYRLFRQNLRWVFYGLLFLLFSFYAVTNRPKIRAQILLNRRFSEFPWYYKSVIELNKYFKSPPKNDNKKPIIISALAPYFIDFYSNGNYRLLPLHPDQEFRHQKVEAWGPNDYSDLIKLYDKYLNDGYPLYIHNYGLGNEGYLQNAFKKVEETFKLTNVARGCYELCNIFKVELKE